MGDAVSGIVEWLAHILQCEGIQHTHHTSREPDTYNRTHAHTPVADHCLGTTLTYKLALGVKSNTLDIVWLSKVSHS